MTTDLVRQAALNNAEWCQAMYRAHGRAGIFQPSLWYTPDDHLPLYPKVVTLEGAAEEGAQLTCIEHLLSARMPGAQDWAVKDSFLTLDLAPLGFGELFRAEWIYAHPREIEPWVEQAGIRWARVTTATELVGWERAWRGSPDEVQLFVPALLEQVTHSFIAIYRNDLIVAGCVASRAAGVVGLSNVFLPVEETESCRQACIAAASACHQGLPLVGYEQGADLTAMLALGLQAIGPLRVWLLNEHVGAA